MACMSPTQSPVQQASAQPQQGQPAPFAVQQSNAPSFNATPQQQSASAAGAPTMQVQQNPGTSPAALAAALRSLSTVAPAGTAAPNLYSSPDATSSVSMPTSSANLLQSILPTGG